ncbi:MAG: carbamoyltransferase HypF [Solirubrobacteraceae bacterium]
MPASTTLIERRRVEVRVRGTVQGVGFRPFVFRLARELGLDGFVLNDASGVVIELEGAGPALAAFLARLGSEAPRLAVVEEVVSSALAPTGLATGFEIVASPRAGVPEAAVTPDSATCERCRQELFDPGDRRFRYPFINCTDCGPRFTIVRGIPYDRPFTTMAGFTMCRSCQAEYDDPGDRRFHAQPNACPACGPRVRLCDPAGQAVGSDSGGRAGSADADGDLLAAAARALRDGQIVAVKGIGGFHLACLAGDEAAVARLRSRKHREDKPFALMTASLQAAAELVQLDAVARELLLSPARPIVLGPRIPGAPVAASVAPGAPEFGVMLPYSPLHHLLLADTGEPLVLTSGNLSDEPIAFRDEDAAERLGAVADLLLLHDRPIETRTDDSIVRSVVLGGRPRTAFLRRSRGYIPATLPLADGGTPVELLACGAELKSTFCLARGERAWVSHHIGDLENYETFTSFVDGIEHFKRLFAVAPKVVVHDLHPEYLSTKYAHEQEDVQLISVQHHHAHLAACLAEHSEPGPAIGAIFDGSGYGSDATIWGGELLYGDLAGFKRIGGLMPVPLPGGAQAIREPWRMARAWLGIADPQQAAAVPAGVRADVSQRSWDQVGTIAATGLASPLTSSVGRLFDAVAALCGVRNRVNYEGQAAIELEAACAPVSAGRAYSIELVRDGDGFVTLDPRAAIRGVAADAHQGQTPGAIATRFHRAVVTATVQACVSCAAAHGTELIVLSGGVFGNRVLLQGVSEGLLEAGLRVLVPERLPAGDGGISYGQAAVAAAQMREPGPRSAGSEHAGSERAGSERAGSERAG